MCYVKRLAGIAPLLVEFWLPQEEIKTAGTFERAEQR
jgi:hypothetical protein